MGFGSVGRVDVCQLACEKDFVYYADALLHGRVAGEVGLRELGEDELRGEELLGQRTQEGVDERGILKLLAILVVSTRFSSVNYFSKANNLCA